VSDDFPGGVPDEDDFPESDRELIDDPEALRRAEEAVAHAIEAPERWVPTDTVWVPVARAATGAAWSLAEVRDMLDGEGIPARFDPHDPRDAISLPYGLPREFAVVVPESRVRDARALVAELAAGGSAWTPVRDERR
jgi:hypothetical protein